MKTYSVLYAEDVSHYGSTQIAAENDAEAIATAKGISEDDLCNIAVDPDHGNTSCKRIVHILDPEGQYIAADIPLDGYTIIHGDDKRRIYESAPTLLKALETIAAIPLWGEPIADADLKTEYSEAAEYDLELDQFEPSVDTESTYLRDAVETAREARSEEHT